MRQMKNMSGLEAYFCGHSPCHRKSTNIRWLRISIQVRPQLEIHTPLDRPVKDCSISKSCRITRRKGVSSKIRKDWEGTYINQGYHSPPSSGHLRVIRCIDTSYNHHTTTQYHTTRNSSRPTAPAVHQVELRRDSKQDENNPRNSRCDQGSFPMVKTWNCRISAGRYGVVLILVEQGLRTSLGE
jgi:hypothetical protein